MSNMLRPASSIASLVLTALVASLASSARAHAQTEPPPAGVDSPVRAAAPAADSPPPAPPGAPAPTTPLPPPVLTPAPPPSLAADPGALPALPPPEEQAPIYRQTWFWAVVGVVALTAIMVTIGISSQGPATPGTDLGNMRAY